MSDAPIQRGFKYEVRLYVSIPLAWATLLKQAAKHHYDHRCNEAGDHGVINGLFNTAQGSEWPSIFPVAWSDLDLITKVAEQLEYHTNDHALIRTIRAWLRKTMDMIDHQHSACMELPGTAEKYAELAEFVKTRCPARDHKEHVGDVCEGSCCTTCGGPIDESEECRCG
jgi:hypothetical protein